jgi:hypothetical protein
MRKKSSTIGPYIVLLNYVDLTPQSEMHKKNLQHNTY